MICLCFNTSVQPNFQVKSLDSRLALTSTSLAAHAVDEVENESEDNIGVAGTASTRVEKGATHEIKDLPPPPPLPILQNSYSQVSTCKFLSFNLLFLHAFLATLFSFENHDLRFVASTF